MSIELRAISSRHEGMMGKTARAQQVVVLSSQAVRYWRLRRVSLNAKKHIMYSKKYIMFTLRST